MMYITPCRDEQRCFFITFPIRKTKSGIGTNHFYSKLQAGCVRVNWMMKGLVFLTSVCFFWFSFWFLVFFLVFSFWFFFAHQGEHLWMIVDAIKMYNIWHHHVFQGLHSCNTSVVQGFLSLFGFLFQEY